MNAVEISEAVTELFGQPMDAVEFPYAFLQAFGNKEATIARLKSGHTNKSDVGGVLQRGNIHVTVAPNGDVTKALAELRDSQATARHKAKFILATDGVRLEAEELGSGDPLSCAWEEFPDHFGMFLPLAGISTVREIRENTFDIRATAKLNKLYVALLTENPDWGTDARRPVLNQFFARLIFCYFAEDTGIFAKKGMFTDTIAQMSAADSSNTHEVVGTLFLSMNTPVADRESASVPRWAAALPYVNGGLFSGAADVPRFSRSARAYLLQAGTLDWTQINPDIFGSMIQAVADDEERGALGMHYTSVPNILKVLNPLLLDELREKLEEAGHNSRKLLNLRSRIARIRVLDPACGSGNFLVIAYKQLREIEHEINRRRGEADRASEIPLKNFRGIELRDFAAEIARLALIIAEFQCDVRYRGERLALAEFLPLDGSNWITCGNALRIDWLSLWPVGTKVRYAAEDLFATPLNQPEIDFGAETGDTFVCGNPPYLGSTWQSSEQKDDLRSVFEGRVREWKLLDYVAGWFLKAADYGVATGATSAFVATNSICQGQHVPALWPAVFGTGQQIAFAHTSFKWSNLAAHKAGVTVVIVGLSASAGSSRQLFEDDDDGTSRARVVPYINAYLIAGANIIVQKARSPLGELAEMDFGNKPVDGGHLQLTRQQLDELELAPSQRSDWTRLLYGSKEFIQGRVKYCLWLDDQSASAAVRLPGIRERVDGVREMRLRSPDSGANAMAARPHQMREMRDGRSHALAVAAISSENRPYLPAGLLPPTSVVNNKMYAMYDAPLWNLALVLSRLHWVWIATVCVRLEMRFSYSNTLGWNTFPVPRLTDSNKDELIRSAEQILLVRESHYPATLADLYEADAMPADLRAAHEQNDEVLERIYIGRRFRNDTERREKLFEMYAKMTESPPTASRQRRRAR